MSFKLLLLLSRHTGHFYSLGQAGLAGDATTPLEPAVARCQLLDDLTPDLEKIANIILILY